MDACSIPVNAAAPSDDPLTTLSNCAVVTESGSGWGSVGSGQTVTCVGVPGNTWQAHADLYALWDTLDTTSKTAYSNGEGTAFNVTSTGLVVATDANGNAQLCGSAVGSLASESGNMDHIPSTAPMVINVHSEVSSSNSDGTGVDALSTLRESLFALSKKWGSTCPALSPSDPPSCSTTPLCWEHGGVIPENVYVIQDTVTVVGEAASRGFQYVLRERVVGDKLSGVNPSNPDPANGAPPLGYGLVWPKPKDTVMPVAFSDIKCDVTSMPQSAISNPNTYSNYTCVYPNGASDTGFAADMAPYMRTGAAVATKTMFGPGRFSIVARARPTDWAGPSSIPPSPVIPTGGDANGRGYVFAAWTFAYLEAYAYDDGGTLLPPPSGLQESNLQWLATPQTSGSVGISYPAGNAACVLTGSGLLRQGDADDGYFFNFNQEIDIEIPSNAPGLTRDANGALNPTKWATYAGLNTMNLVPWMSDINVYEGTTPLYSQLTAARTDGSTWFSTDGLYHTYEIEWLPSSDPASAQINYYFDGTKVLSTRRFTPRGAMRLVVGPWMSWWASGGNVPAFAFSAVDIAEIRYAPAQSVVATAWSSMPQTYDQSLGSAGTIQCGFVPLPTVSVPDSAPPAGNSGKGIPTWLILLIVAVILVGVIIAAIITKFRRTDSENNEEKEDDEDEFITTASNNPMVHRLMEGDY